jgi:hypothetical protein
MQGPGQRGGLWEGENPPGSGVGVVAVGEVSLQTAGLEHERKAAIRRHRLEADLRRQTLGIHRALPLHPRQGGASRFGLDNPDGFLVNIDQVVRPAMTLGHDDLTDRYSLPSEEVKFPAVLHHPASVGELAVNQNPSTLFSDQMTARDEILDALPRLRARLASDDFTPAEVLQELRRAGSVYSDSAVRTHIVSRMCSNAPDNQAVVYNDLERIGHGHYRQREV